MKMFTVITILTLIAIPVFSGGQAEEPPRMENTVMESDASMAPETGPFIEFRDSSHAMMLAEEKPTVLFFNASWCPSCRAAREDFMENSEKLTDVNLIIVDYDNSDELQKKYGVTYQHTYVQIDSEGTAITKWNGGETEELLEKIMMKEM